MFTALVKFHDCSLLIRLFRDHGDHDDHDSMTTIFIILLLLCAIGHTQMSYNTNTEKIFAVTRSVGLYGDISNQQAYKPQFRLRTKISVPFNIDIKTITKKDQISSATISEWKENANESKKKAVTILIRNLSIQEVWDIRVLLASYQGSNNPETDVLTEWQCYKTHNSKEKSYQTHESSLLKKERRNNKKNIERNWSSGYDTFTNFLATKYQQIHW